MKWYRSLYWRIALGFMLALAAMLVVQAVLFVWVAARSGPTVPGRPPDRFALNVALDLMEEIERDPGADLSAYVREHYGSAIHPVYIVLRDGRVVANTGDAIPEPLLAQARARLAIRPPDGGPFFPRDPDLRRPDRPSGAADRAVDRPDVDRPELARPNSGRPDFDRFGRGGPGFRRTVPILVNGEVAGMVVVPPEASFGFLFRRFAPTLGVVALASLITAGLAATVAIFGPARRRLREVEDAARRLGAGDLTARAPSQGGDEVAAVATAFNAMADDLAVRADALAASDRARRHLLADVSHELTTPITAMRGYLETLSMPELAVDEETRARYLVIIGDETQRLEGIIGDLLDLARLEGGGGTLAVGDVRVEQLFARVVARHERRCLDAGLSITTAIEPGAEVVRGDRDRLEQALQNLAANAIRYAPPGTAVHLRAATQGDRVTIWVADEGPGISPDHLPHVFDRFYKADVSRTPRGEDAGGGSGLGLSIVKAIVERHGGQISVSSRPGRTVFQFTIG